MLRWPMADSAPVPKPQDDAAAQGNGLGPAEAPSPPERYGCTLHCDPSPLPAEFCESVHGLEKVLGMPVWLLVQHDGNRFDEIDYELSDAFVQALGNESKNKPIALLLHSPGESQVAHSRSQLASVREQSILRRWFHVPPKALLRFWRSARIEFCWDRTLNSDRWMRKSGILTGRASSLLLMRFKRLKDSTLLRWKRLTALCFCLSDERMLKQSPYYHWF